MTAPKLKACRECGRELSYSNRNGLCRTHHLADRLRRRSELDSRIMAGLAARKSGIEIARELGCSVDRIYKASCRRAPTATPHRRRRIGHIIDVAAKLAGIARIDLVGPSRMTALTIARQAVCLVGMEAGHSSSEVGVQLGRRDHSTILHGRDAAIRRARSSAEYAAFLARLRATPEPGVGEGAPSVSSYHRVLKAKNDFHSPEEADEDDGHRFQAGIAAGSRMLLHAILEARAA
jgi:hypothetical protein